MCGKQGWGPAAFFSDMQYLDDAIHWTYIANVTWTCYYKIIPPSLLTQFIHVAPRLSYFVGLKNKAGFLLLFCVEVWPLKCQM